MKTIKLIAIGIASSALMFSSCKKDEKTTDTTVAASTLLTGKDWRVVGIVLTVPGAPPVDMYAAMPACEKDDLMEFLAAGTVTKKAGASKCNPSDPDTEPAGNWALLNSNTKLRVIDGDTTLMNIKELTATSLKLELEENDMGNIYTTSISMVKN